MAWFRLVSCFFGGAFVTNAMPHFVSGVMGKPFPSPFAKPPGKGLSSATVNVLWGFLNIVAGYVLTCRIGDFEWKVTADVMAFELGMLAMGLLLAHWFGPLQQGRKPGRS